MIPLFYHSRLLSLFTEALIDRSSDFSNPVLHRDHQDSENGRFLESCISIIMLFILKLFVIIEFSVDPNCLMTQSHVDILINSNQVSS